MRPTQPSAARFDAAGPAYWTAQIDAGKSLGSIIQDIISGAQGNDPLTINNRPRSRSTTPSTTETGDLTSQISPSRNVLAGVTADPNTVSEAEKKIDVVPVPLSPTPTPTRPQHRRLPHPDQRRLLRRPNAHPDAYPTPTPTPTPTPAPTTMNLTNAGDMVALNGADGDITLTEPTL